MPYCHVNAKLSYSCDFYVIYQCYFNVIAFLSRSVSILTQTQIILFSFFVLTLDTIETFDSKKFFEASETPQNMYMNSKLNSVLFLSILNQIKPSELLQVPDTKGGAKSGFSDKGVPITQPPMEQMT